MKKGVVSGWQQPRTTLIKLCTVWSGGETLASDVKKSIGEVIHVPKPEELERHLNTYGVPYHELKEKALAFAEGETVEMKNGLLTFKINREDPRVFLRLESCAYKWQQCECIIGYPVWYLHGEEVCQCVICGSPCPRENQCRRLEQAWKRVLGQTKRKRPW